MSWFFNMCDSNMHGERIKTAIYLIIQPWKSIPYSVLDRPLRFQEVEASKFQDSRHMKAGKVVSPTHRSTLPPRKYSWYSFLLQAELTKGP
jgi:hypothetical protein